MAAKRGVARALLVGLAVAGLAGCGSARIWPFGEEAPTQAAAPQNATHYRCVGGKSFYLRMLADGDAWVILSERQVRLAKSGSAGRFTSGATELLLAAAEADSILNDGPNNPHTGCKPVRPE